MPLSSLPPELLNLIVDHLRDKPIALKASYALPPIVDGAFRTLLTLLLATPVAS